MIEDAKNQAANISSRSAEIKEEVKTKFEGLNETVSKLLASLNDLNSQSMQMASSARDLIDEGLDLVEDAE